MLILVGIVFLIDTNVIAGPARFLQYAELETVVGDVERARDIYKLSVDIPKNESSSITVLNACSQDPPCLVSCIIVFGDVKLYRSPILDSAEKSYFPYANTTNGLRVTIFKHINVQDPGTVIITKKLGDGNHCVAVSGNYSTPKISNCLNGNTAPACEKGEDDPDWRTIIVSNNCAENFRVILQSYHGNRVTYNHTVYPSATAYLKFRGSFCKPISSYNYTFSLFKQRISQMPVETQRNRQMPIETMRGSLSLPELDACITVTGNYTTPIFQVVPCTTFEDLEQAP